MFQTAGGAVRQNTALPVDDLPDPKSTLSRLAVYQDLSPFTSSIYECGKYREREAGMQVVQLQDMSKDEVSTERKVD
ncbi:hypothetical protein PG993_004841 [Apiospora rasikravindrae]|uniref:Uncharacterized protein n=1 Tax=Apiospora rasikravindrae TaxID=990691 RepID=A0ABR1TDY9_9PEZI